MADRRSAEEVLGGYINVTVGHEVRHLPTLKIKAAREWRQSLSSRMAGMAKTSIGDLDLTALPNATASVMVGAGPILQLGSDLVLELVLDYDRTSALGGREHLEADSDDAEIYAALQSILGVVFPFVTDLRALLQEVLGMVGSAASIADRSTNSQPRNGASIPAVSKSGSTSRS